MFFITQNLSGEVSKAGGERSLVTPGFCCSLSLLGVVAKQGAGGGWGWLEAVRLALHQGVCRLQLRHLLRAAGGARLKSQQSLQEPEPLGFII